MRVFIVRMNPQCHCLLPVCPIPFRSCSEEGQRLTLPYTQHDAEKLIPLTGENIFIRKQYMSW
jgi:hypothetical protein